MPATRSMRQFHVDAHPVRCSGRRRERTLEQRLPCARAHPGRRMQQNFLDCAVFVEFHEYPEAFQIASRALLALLHRAEMFICELFSQLRVVRLAFRRF